MGAGAAGLQVTLKEKGEGLSGAALGASSASDGRTGAPTASESSLRGGASDLVGGARAGLTAPEAGGQTEGFNGGSSSVGRAETASGLGRGDETKGSGERAGKAGGL